MLEEFITKVLVVLFGYAYPAFECFKMVEERPGEIEQLRFWCQYWSCLETRMDRIKYKSDAAKIEEFSNLEASCEMIIVAIVTVIEMLAETVVSWVPLYEQVKLAFFVYLWYPKTKGSDLVYETFLRPLVMQYEPDIEQRLRHLRAKSGQFLMFYIKNFSDKGSTLFFEALNYVVSQGSRVSRTESFFSRNRRSGSSPAETKHSSMAYYDDSDTMGSTADDAAAGGAKRRPRHKY